ncbi:hypothetical protein ACO22_05729 [Paracoccidioides brasiliensis]|uniref:Uncharacterized protein n=1 Tax=Paracoccidioides brasiliensis TaxID=121759 RepID=A0A1D2J9M3_PARBR|nr:hypothetical protein ACO22_05729 [Paracoccidioides brasiliensis]ODH47100.1 hypothetical protein GX48_06813 [Paracoccidioides brasiliensis]
MVRLNLAAVLLSLGGADALSDRLLPRETVQLMADVFGMSPLPTDPPGVPRGLPKELAARAVRTAIDYPAPGYYCGLVNGDINNLLTCAFAGANCVQYGTAVGCCASSNAQQCTDIATKCLNWEDKCDEACSKDPRIIRCAETTLPFCGTYFFGNGKQLLGCRASVGVSSQVVLLSEYFSSRYGPNYQTLAGTSSVLSMSLSPGTATETAEPTATRTSPSKPQNSGDVIGDKDDGDGGKGKKKLGGGAIGGIVAGAVVGIIAIAAIIVFFYRKGKKNGSTQGLAPTAPLMQEQQYGQPVVGAGYFAPEQKAPPYSPGYAPQVHQPPPGPSEMAGSPIQNPLQAQSQPLLGASTEYYNQSRGNSYIQPGSPPTNSTSPQLGTSRPVSLHRLSATHNGPVPEDIYEMPAADRRR